MRKTVFALLAVFVALAMLAPPVLAQAPQPKVTINGLWDNVTSITSNVDGDFTNDDDDMWYARTRVRPDITGQVGKTKAVLGLEIDGTWGGGSTKIGTTRPWDLNVDEVTNIELKWAYVETPVTGPDSLLPFIPVPTVGRFGAQPFATTYKLGVLATGDFAGVNLVTTWGPTAKTHLTFVQVEEELNGSGAACNATGDCGAGTGEDVAVIASLDLTPWKGLSVRPIYAYLFVDGTTSGSARRAVGGGPAFALGQHENRHTIGLDAQWRWGAFSLDPTFLYQFGDRDATRTQNQDISAWLLDLRGGWRAGPLLLEAMFAWSSGNDATDDLAGGTDDVNYFQPIDTDTTWNAGWAEIWSLGTDYFIGNVFFPTGNSISYDRYGIIAVGGRATYALTPALSVKAMASALWTAEEVDTDRAVGSHFSAPVNSGDESYLGTEVNLGLSWRFAPNVSLDVGGGYFFAGEALDATRTTTVVTQPDPDLPPVTTTVRTKQSADDGYLLSSRLRFFF